MSFVDLPANPDGTSGRGYLVVPEAGSGPGVVVIQEWWGVNPDIQRIARLLAANGFVALAPDLYRGDLAGHDEMDKAGELMSSLPPERAAADLGAAVDFLRDHPATTGNGIGVVGFCMGGMLTLLLAAQRGDVVKAAVPFYGVPAGELEPDWSGLTAVVRGHMAEQDEWFPVDVVRGVEANLRAAGKDVEFTVHPGTGHAFMGEHDTFGTFDRALADGIWSDVFGFLHQRLD